MRVPQLNRDEYAPFMFDSDRTTLVVSRVWLTLPCAFADAGLRRRGVERLPVGELSLQGDEATPLLDYT